MTSTRGKSVQLVDVGEGKVVEEVAVGVAPYTILGTRPGRYYVSNWGGDPPKEGDLQARSSGSPTPGRSRGIASQGTRLRAGTRRQAVAAR